MPLEDSMPKAPSQPFKFQGLILSVVVGILVVSVIVALQCQ